MTTARIVALTQPNMTITDCETAEQFVAYAARVSNPANQNNNETADKLIRYLIKHHHWSPFEMVSITMEIETTRDIGRQILRHRSFSFQEFSQRYAQATEFVTREARLQDTKNRQNSISTADAKLREWWQTMQDMHIKAAEQSYVTALEKGIAKEQARAVLPEGLTATRMYMAGTLRSWIHYCDLRRAHGTQKEHMEVANCCWAALGVKFPNVIKALEPENELVSRITI
jgi:thymidylate synthase (FAD)